MSKLLQWFRYHNDEITWWIIGWLSFAAIDCILRDNWTMAFIDVVLIYVNYKLWKNNNA